MLALLAAIVPIVASIYAGLSFMAEVADQARIVRAYERVEAWYRPRYSALMAEARDPERHGGADLIMRRTNELNARRGMLLGYNGINPSTNTCGHLNRLMTPAAAPRGEVRRQWAILFGAIAGVILLALDALTEL
ncbi:hypothetical protein F6W69_06345 [Microbacterium oxydans]|nr:hypothetical protein F6W69_06345 [Microbacterium oxydans]GED38142.1 hypothetical protein MOX01_12840 [Microbacterium oxydans]